MCEVIKFGSKKENIIEKKYDRFKQLKEWRFSGILNDNEEKELDELSEWLQIHSV